MSNRKVWKCCGDPKYIFGYGLGNDNDELFIVIIQLKIVHTSSWRHGQPNPTDPQTGLTDSNGFPWSAG